LTKPIDVGPERRAAHAGRSHRSGSWPAHPGTPVPAGGLRPGDGRLAGRWPGHVCPADHLVRRLFRRDHGAAFRL